MSRAGMMITPLDPKTQDCYWCGEPSTAAYLPNRKGAATFIYVCAKHVDQAERALWERRQPGQAGFGREKAKSPPK